MKPKSHRTAKTICGVSLYNLWCEFIEKEAKGRERSKGKSRKQPLRHRDGLAFSPKTWAPWLTRWTNRSEASAFRRPPRWWLRTWELASSLWALRFYELSINGRKEEYELWKYQKNNNRMTFVWNHAGWPATGDPIERVPVGKQCCWGTCGEAPSSRFTTGKTACWVQILTSL